MFIFVNVWIYKMSFKQTLVYLTFREIEKNIIQFGYLGNHFHLFLDICSAIFQITEHPQQSFDVKIVVTNTELNVVCKNKERQFEVYIVSHLIRAHSTVKQGWTLRWIDDHSVFARYRTPTYVRRLQSF